MQHSQQAKFTCSDEMFFNRHLSNYLTEQNVISKRTMKKCDRHSRMTNSFDNVVIYLVGSVVAMQNFQHAILDERCVCTRYFTVYNLNFNILCIYNVSSNLMEYYFKI